MTIIPGVFKELGKLRVFTNAEDAKAWELDHAGRGTICLVDGVKPTLRWYWRQGRCYGRSRTPNRPPDASLDFLWDLLDLYGDNFYSGIFQGYLQGFPPKRLSFLVRTICDVTGARP